MRIQQRLSDFATKAPEVADIMSLGKSLDLEVDDDDINELVDEDKVTTEKLLYLQEHQYTNATEKIKELEIEKNLSEVLPTSDIKEMLAMWQKAQHNVEKCHPQKLSACCAAALVNDNGVDYFCAILNSRTRQITLDRFFKKRSASAQSDGSRAKNVRVSDEDRNIKITEIVPPDASMDIDSHDRQ